MRSNFPGLSGWMMAIGSLFVGVLLIAGCSADNPISSMPATDEVQTSPRDENSEGSLDCHNDDAVHAEAWIGPNGGELRLRDHKLRVPRNAVSTLTLFTMDIDPASEVGVDCGPAGQQFAIPVELKLNYKDTEWENLENPELTIYWIPDGGDWDDRVDQGGSVESITKKVCASLYHFSRYIIGQRAL